MQYRPIWLSAICAIALISGCSSKTSLDSGEGFGEVVKLNGSGASFPAPLYERWFKTYSQSHDDVRVDYQGTGSGAGIKAFISGTVDFAASDAAMTDEEMAEVKQGVQLLPLTAGEIVLAYNLEGVEDLKLSRAAYTGILLGQITNWNDTAIAAANPGVTLPDQPITVVVRADSSGTTFVFTQHLSEVNAEWAAQLGAGKTVNWPDSDKFIRALKNEGVTGQITQIPGAIGYIEYGFAKLNDLTMASLENAAGTFVKPSLQSGQAALANVEMPADLRAWLPDPEGADAYPIVTYTWLLAYEQYDDPKKAEAVKEMVKYCLNEGQKVSDEMGYIPLPESVVTKVTAALDNIQ